MGRLELDIRYEKRKKFWYYKLKDDKAFHSTGKSKKTDAILFAKEQQNNMSNPFTKDILFSDYASKFFSTETCPHCLRLFEEGKNLAPYTIATNKLNLKNHILPSHLSKLKITDIRRRDILDFRKTLTEKKLAGGTVNKIMSALKIILNEAYFREDIIKNPVDGVGLVKEECLSPDIFTIDELKLLFPEDFKSVWTNQLSFTCFFLTALTGMRKSEVLALKWKHINLEEKFIKIENAWKSSTEIGLPKGGKARTVPISEPLYMKLTDLYNKSHNKTYDSLVFCYADGSRLGGTWWTKNFKKGIEKSGIKIGGRKIVPHSFRHTLNSIYRSNNLNPDKIRATLGWNSEVVQNNYTHWKPKDFIEQDKTIEKIWK